MGKEGRVRLKGSSKGGKRWGKGQSGLSNPQTHKHRNAAKGKFENHLAQVSSPSNGLILTKDTLATHNTIHKEERSSFPPALKEEEEIGGEERESMASSSIYSLIETSNPIFGRVKRLWNSPMETHREICAVLAAVSEVIKDKNGTESVTEYFAALVTALESSDEEQSTTAVAYLLSIVMEKISPSILQSQFSSVGKVLMNTLTQYQSSTATSLLKSVAYCLIMLLSVQLPSVWSDSYTQTVLQSTLNFIIHPKPKLRKAAHSGLAGMLREGDPSSPSEYKFHPSSSFVARYCQLTLEREGIETSSLHTLTFLKDCLANFPTQYIKSLCEALLKLITLGKSVVKMTGFHCLNGLFTSVVGPQGMTPTLNGRIITALYDHQPNSVDVQSVMAWATVMESAHIKLLNLEANLCFGHLPKFFQTCLQLLLATNKSVTKLGADIMKNLLKECVPVAIKAFPDKGKKGKTMLEYSTLLSLFKYIENALSYKYQYVWDHVLGVLESFYFLAGKDCHQFMLKSLKSLNELRNVSGFVFVSELEAAFGAAIKTMGPRVVLGAVPLKLDVLSDPPDFPQSWLLPVLQEYVEGTELSYYIEELLPIAGVMRGLGEDCVKSGKHLQAKLFTTLEHQIWSLLLSFCTRPLDIPSAFSGIAKILGTALTEKIEVRGIICNSLKRLIETSRDNEAAITELSRFAKNYLPLLFNLYTIEPYDGDASSREAVLEAIKAYLSIANEKLLQGLFSKVTSKLSQSDISPQSKIALEDMTEGFIPFLDESSLTDLLQLITPILDSDNNTAQKKAYKLLATILSCDTPNHSSFVATNLSQLQSMLLSSLSTAGIGSKKPRLRCLLTIVPRLTEEHIDFLLAVVPEAILCTKENNEKCRNLSYQLLSRLGHASQQLYNTTPEDSMREYFNVVLAGLAGSTHMVSSTIGALARLVYEFHDLLGAELLETLLSSVTVFLSAKAREVVRSTLVFIKVAIGVIPHTDLAPHVKELVEKVLTWSSNDRNHFRMKSRVILERLIRKYNHEMIASYVPSKHKRLVAHIRKMNEQQKRKKRAKWEEAKNRHKNNDSDSFMSSSRPSNSKPSFEELLYDSDDEMEGNTRKTQSEFRNRTKGGEKGKTWIKEDDDKPLDLLDKSAGRHMLGTNPNNSTRKRLAAVSGDDFHFSSDGKLMINEEPMEEEKKGHDNSSSRKRVRQDDDKELEEEFQSYVLTGIRRKDPVKYPEGEVELEQKLKKLKGDVKKKGQLEPYSYIQLDRQQLNRRKKAKLSGQFKGIMTKAQRGSVLGRKQRRKKTK